MDICWWWCPQFVEYTAIFPLPFLQVGFEPSEVLNKDTPVAFWRVPERRTFGQKEQPQNRITWFFHHYRRTHLACTSKKNLNNSTCSARVYYYCYYLWIYNNIYCMQLTIHISWAGWRSLQFGHTLGDREYKYSTNFVFPITSYLHIGPTNLPTLA